MRFNAMLVLCVMAMIVVLLFTGCTKSIDVKPVAVEKQTIKIGVSMPLTGAVADQGTRFIQGANLALEAYDSDKYAIELVIEDDKCSATDATNVVNKMVNIDGIDKIIVYCSAAVPPFIEPIKTQDGLLFVESIKLEMDEGKNPFLFNMLPPPQKEVGLISDNILSKGISNVAVIYQQDYFGETYKNKFIKEFESAGGKVMYVEGYDKNANKDFRTAISKFKGSGIAAVVNFMAHPANFDLLLKQARELEYYPAYFGQWITENPTLLNLSGNLSEGIIYSHSFVSPETEKFESMRSAYIAKYNRDMNLDTINGYDTINLISQLVNLCGDDAACMTEKLNSGIEFEGILGKIRFTGNMKDADVFLKTISSRKFVKLE